MIFRRLHPGICSAHPRCAKSFSSSVRFGRKNNENNAFEVHQTSLATTVTRDEDPETVHLKFMSINTTIVHVLSFEHHDAVPPS